MLVKIKEPMMRINIAAETLRSCTRIGPVHKSTPPLNIDSPEGSRNLLISETLLGKFLDSLYNETRCEIGPYVIWLDPTSGWMSSSHESDNNHHESLREAVLFCIKASNITEKDSQPNGTN